MSDYNIAQNGSFEYDLDGTNIADGWQPFKKSGTTAAMTYEKGKEKAYIGQSAVSISNSQDWAVYGNMQTEPLRSGVTYTASAMVKAENVT